MSEETSAGELNGLLDMKIDATITVREALATQFIAWALGKVNNLEAFNSDVQAIVALSTQYPGRLMSDEKKLEIMQKLVKLGVL